MVGLSLSRPQCVEKQSYLSNFGKKAMRMMVVISIEKGRHSMRMVSVRVFFNCSENYLVCTN